MKAVGLKDVMEALTLQEQVDVVLAFFRWGFHPVHYADMPTDAELETFAAQLADFRVHIGGDVKPVHSGLKIALTENFRGMKIIQREASGPWFNTFMKATLAPHVFDLWYRAAGLDPDALGYKDLPQDITICMCDFGRS